MEEGKSAEFISSLKIVDKSISITWYKNSTIIRESSDIRIIFDGSIAKLTISKCKITDTATYKCVAKNDFGEDEVSATLTVTKKVVEEEEVINFEIKFSKLEFYFSL